MRESCGRFVFHNENPRKLVRAADCTFRAISKALDISWEVALTELTKVALKEKDAPNSDRVIEKYLYQEGFTKEKQLRKANNKKYTVDEFAELKNQGTYIIRIANHISVVVDGYIYDTWDIRHKTVGNYWKIK